MRVQLLEILLAAPLFAQITHPPWTVQSIQRTAITGGSLPGTTVSATGEIYLYGGSTYLQYPAATRTVGDTSRWSTFVVKADPSGRPLFTVQIGGTYRVDGLALDTGGNAYITGAAGPSGFATTPGAYRSSPAGDYASYVCKLSSGDGQPFFCTFLDITGLVLAGIAVDAAGNVFVAGSRPGGQSAPASPGALNQGDRSIYVAKLDASGAKLIYQAAFGGSNWEQVLAMAVDAAGNVYVAGRTLSPDFPVTGNALISSVRLTQDQPYAAFVAKLNASGNAVLYATYGNVGEQPLRIALDPAQNAQILGVTPRGELFVRRYNSDASGLLFEKGLQIPIRYFTPLMAIDSAGTTSIVSSTESVDFPVKGATQSCRYMLFSSGGADGFLLRLGSSGEVLQSTFLRGNGSPIFASLLVGPAGASVAVWSVTLGQLPSPLEMLRIGPDANAPEMKFACVGNAASLTGAPLAPGEIISLFGAAIGPSTPVFGQPGPDQRFPFTLADIQVTFDGAPAPLLYVSDQQINAVAPWRLAGKTSTQVCVVLQGTKTNCIDSSVRAAAPAIFRSWSTSDYGASYAAAVNQDGTINSPQNRAPIGSIISLYATGLGPTEPASLDGALILPPLPSQNYPVQVIVPNPDRHSPYPAFGEVLYAGPAPFSIAGLSQINVRVPNSGGIFSLRVFLPNGTQSQSDYLPVWTAPPQ